MREGLLNLEHAARPGTIKWLMAGDPSIRWQVMRDLGDFAAEAMAAERARVALEGWGAELLAQQADDGSWPGGQWDLVTLWSLVVLKDLGLDPHSVQARRMMGRVADGLVFEAMGDRPFLDGETEPCINGRILAVGAYFSKPNHALARQLMSEQLEDGGWNCEAPVSCRSSFNTTICVLDGLLAYERAVEKTEDKTVESQAAAVTAARLRAEAYLLDRRLFRGLRTGEVIDKRWLRFTYPTHWHYDVLRGLDYLREAGVRPDERVREAMEVVVQRGHQNGRWPLNLLHRESIPLEMETGIGRASRWNTLRALRVLGWYAEAQG